MQLIQRAGVDHYCHRGGDTEPRGDHLPGSTRPTSPIMVVGSTRLPLHAGTAIHSRSKSVVASSKFENPGTNVDFAVFKSYGASYGEFSEPGFPHTIAKK